MTFDPEMIIKHRVAFPDVVSTGDDVDESSASGQKVLKIGATGNFDATDGNKGWRVIIGKGTEREEERKIDTLQGGISLTFENNLVYNHTFTQEQTIDQSSASGQKKVYLTATANLLAGETVVMSEGETEEESGVIASVNSDDYITLVENLANTHGVSRKCKHTAPEGISVVEVLWAGVSEVIVKKHYNRLVLFLPANWKTTKITFLGCPTKDGTFIQVESGVAGAELEVAEVDANKCIGLDGILVETLANIPYLKLRSGVAATEIDQYGNVIVNYVLMR